MVIYEAVIDLSDPGPRIAYLRDISLLSVTAKLAANASLDQDDARYTLDEPALEPAAGDATDEASGFDDVFAMDAPEFGDPFDEDSRRSPPGDSNESSRDELGASSASVSPPRPGRRVGRWFRGG